MELQLGLGLPGGGNCKSSMMKQLGFDLNNCFDHHDQQYNYNSKGHHHHHVFAASCSSNSNTNQLNVDVEIKTSTKRSFDEAFDHDHQLENSPPDHVPQTLPLLVWTTTTNNSNLSDQDDNINDHDNHDLDTTTSSSIIINKNELGEIESGVIGWPPVKSSRKKLCHHHKHGGECSKSMFVKVKMEGVGIGRKVDLTLHASYHTLTNTLMAMFGKCQEDVKSYNLTYQDKEGDWLLAGDVPWGSFIETVQRLKLLKKGG